MLAEAFVGRRCHTNYVALASSYMLSISKRVLPLGDLGGTESSVKDHATCTHCSPDMTVDWPATLLIGYVFFVRLAVLAVVGAQRDHRTLSSQYKRPHFRPTCARRSILDTATGPFKLGITARVP